MNNPHGKRVGPPEVPPAHIGPLRIEALHWGRERGLGQNGGFIRAVDERTGTEEWVLQVYGIDYDPEMEEDVQDIFIRSIQLVDEDASLLIADERGRHFRVAVESREVTTL
jgi:hypothetical protein